MPIEIRELVIRATVDPESGEGGCGAPAKKVAGGKPAGTSTAAADEGTVQSCVREVLRILDEKRER
jgi:hypothetical protein